MKKYDRHDDRERITIMFGEYVQAVLYNLKWYIPLYRYRGRWAEDRSRRFKTEARCNYFCDTHHHYDCRLQGDGK